MPYLTPEMRKQNKEKWIARMEDWQNSGLSGAAWCRQKEIMYHQFFYWKKRLSDESNHSFNADSFIELDDYSESSGIEIVLNGAFIRLSKDFDSSTLLRCLRTLRDAKC